MAEREADRARSERLRRQAVVALASDASREISPQFLQQLRGHDAAPSLFGASELAMSARTGFEVEIVRNISAGQFEQPQVSKTKGEVLKLRRLLEQHRYEWNAFVCDLPDRSWVGEIVGQL
jgi:hypothetical protein